MGKPRLLDAFCGAGGAAAGYVRAGFDVTGIDIAPQPRYLLSGASAFVRGDALAYVREHGHEFDAIHCSPPCQAYSEATPLAVRATLPALIPATRDALIAAGRPYAIENVENARAHLINPVMLCGTMFGLPIWRHRWFEVAPFWFLAPATCRHDGRPVVIHPGSNARKGAGHTSATVARTSMGVEWMSRDEAYEAIPPVYTEHIGRQLLTALGASVAA